MLMSIPAFGIRLFYIDGPLVKRSRRRPLTPQTGVRFSHGSPRRNGLHSIQKAQPFGWAFLIPFRHSSLSPQNFAWQTFARAPPPEANGTPAEWTAFHSKSEQNGWAFLIPFRHSSLSPQNFAWQTFAGAPLPEANGTPAEWTAFHSKSEPFGWAFLESFTFFSQARTIRGDAIVVGPAYIK